MTFVACHVIAHIGQISKIPGQKYDNQTGDLFLKNFHFPKLIKQKMIYKKYWLKSNACRISLTYILLLFQIVKPDFVNHDIMVSLNISNFIKMHVSYRSRLSNILSPPALDDFFQNPISWGVSLLPSSVIPNVFGLNMKHLVRT